MAAATDIIKLGAALLVVSALTGCDQPKWRGKAADTPAAGGSAAGSAAGAMPALPAWAGELIGKPLKATFPAEGQCVGNTEATGERYAGASPGAKVIGWGWDTAAKQAVPRVLLVDRALNIVGAGETGLERLDVPAARPEITSTTTGWWALTPSTTGYIDAYGVLADGKTVCKLGHIDL